MSLFFFWIRNQYVSRLFLRFVGFEFLIYKVPKSFLAFSSVRIFLPIRRWGQVNSGLRQIAPNSLLTVLMEKRRGGRGQTLRYYTSLMAITGRILEKHYWSS